MKKAEAVVRTAAVPVKEPALWTGLIRLSDLVKANFVARRVFGRPAVQLGSVLGDTLHVEGRIPPENVWRYINKLKYSTSRSVCL